MGDVDLQGQSAGLEDNLEFVADCCRYAENILSEEAIKKKYRFDDATWESLGENDALVEAIHRGRKNTPDTQRQHQTRARAKTSCASARRPGGIMLDASASPKHRIDSAKALDAFAANGSEAAPASDRFQITINLGADVLHFVKSIAVDANDVDPFNDTDTTPQELLAAIAANKRKDDGGGEPI